MMNSSPARADYEFHQLRRLSALAEVKTAVCLCDGHQQPTTERLFVQVLCKNHKLREEK